MPRIPLKQVETGPIIAPALAMANQIREGRARASLAETTAANAPEQQRLALGQQQATLEGTQQMNEYRPKAEARAEAQEGRTAEKDKLDMAGKKLDVINKTLAQTTSPESFQKATSWLIEQGIAPEGGFDELPQSAQTPEGFMEYRNNVLIPEFGMKQKEIDARMESYKSQERVANIYANSRNKENAYRDLDGQDYRLIEADLYDEYARRYGDWVVEGTNTVWKKKPNAPEWNEETANQLFKEKVKRVKSGRGASQPGGTAKPKWEWQ